jgi:hypothetical protein
MNEPDLICQSTVKDLLLNWGRPHMNQTLADSGIPLDSARSKTALADCRVQLGPVLGRERHVSEHVSLGIVHQGGGIWLVSEAALS